MTTAYRNETPISEHKALRILETEDDTMDTNCIEVRVDTENNAEEWWSALTEAYPRFAASLRKHGAAVIAEPLWVALAALPGFKDGPEYAPTALIRHGDPSDGRHDVFVELN